MEQLGQISEWLWEHSIAFHGHKVFPMGIVPNIAWAIIPLWVLPTCAKGLNDPKRSGVLRFIVGFIWITVYPNAAYLFLEIKHVLVRDYFVENVNLEAIVVFAFLSLLGLSLHVATTLQAVKRFHILRDKPTRSILLLCTLASLGTVLGIQDLHTVVVWFFPQTILYSTVETFLSGELTLLTIGLAAFLAAVTLAIHKLPCMKS